jgi:hypothetical protein
MPNYGPELNGDTVISTDTTFNETFLSFRTLTVDSGVTMTVPHLCSIFCTGVIDVNGTIKVEKGQAGGGDTTAAGEGGDGGGSVNIVSFAMQGNGKVAANGGDGVDVSGNTATTDETGGPGQALRIPHEPINVRNPTGDSDAIGGESISEFFDLFIENRLLSGSFVSQQSIQQSIAGSGAAGAEDTFGNAKGGGGGGFGGPGGDGAAPPSNPPESNGPGGGGAGGQIIVMSENLAPNDDLTLEAKGGDGGERTQISSGGGGGGGGGMVIAVADRPASSVYSVAGGVGPGTAEDGGDGIAMRYPVSQF